MKFIIAIFLTASFLNPISSGAQNRSINFEQGTMKQILSKAAVSKRLVFVDCYTSWCVPCKAMAAQVFTRDSVADFFNSNFINAKMDMEKGEGVEMGNKYSIGAYPSFLLLDTSGNIVYKFVGGMTADSFLTTVKLGLDPKNRVATMNAEYANGNRCKNFLREYIKLKIELKEIKDGQKIAQEYFDMLSPKERTLPENWYLFGENRYSLYLSNIYDKNFNYLADHWKEFAKANGKEIVELKLASSYRKIAEYVLRGWYFKEHPYEKAVFEKYHQQLKNTEIKEKDQLLKLMDMAQAAGEKDTSKLINVLADNIGSFSEENKKIVFAFVNMLNSSNGYLKQYTRCSEIFDKIIKTSNNKILVSTASRYLQYYNTDSKN